MKAKNLFYVNLILYNILFLVLFSSCSARIDGEVYEGGRVELRLSSSLGTRTIALIRSMRGFMGEGTDAPILDGNNISASMSNSPGMGSISLVNTSPSSLEGTLSIIRVGDFLSLAGTDTRLITYTETASFSSIVFYLELETAPALISMLSPEVEEYLLALMAPAVLGDIYTREEYLSLLGMVYGRPLADEIAAAFITALIQFPRQPVSALGGSINGRNVEYNIPLLDLLVLEEPLSYEVIW